MRETIDRYFKQGWHVSVNREGQLIFANPDNTTFFTLGIATKTESDYIQMLKSINYGVRVRKRFIH